MPDRIAIVSGVSRGLGEALATDLLGNGIAVLGVGRTDSIRLQGADRYRFVGCDLADAAAIDDTLTSVFRETASRRHDAAYLINNAATTGPTGILGRLDAPSVAWSLAINLAAPVALANLFCRTFNDPSADRRIINVSSGAAQSAITGGGAYSIAKAGLEMLTRQLTAEQADTTLRAITVRPGIIDTDMQTYMRSQAPDVLPSVGRFQRFHESGQLVAPHVVAAKIVRRLVLGDVERGRTYTYQEL